MASEVREVRAPATVSTQLTGLRSPLSDSRIWTADSGPAPKPGSERSAIASRDPGPIRATTGTPAPASRVRAARPAPPRMSRSTGLRVTSDQRAVSSAAATAHSSSVSSPASWGTSARSRRVTVVHPGIRQEQPPVDGHAQLVAREPHPERLLAVEDLAALRVETPVHAHRVLPGLRDRHGPHHPGLRAAVPLQVPGERRPHRLPVPGGAGDEVVQALLGRGPPICAAMLRIDLRPCAVSRPCRYCSAFRRWSRRGKPEKSADTARRRRPRAEPAAPTGLTTPRGTVGRDGPGDGPALGCDGCTHDTPARRLRSSLPLLHHRRPYPPPGTRCTRHPNRPPNGGRTTSRRHRRSKPFIARPRGIPGEAFPNTPRGI